MNKTISIILSVTLISNQPGRTELGLAAALSILCLIMLLSALVVWITYRDFIKRTDDE